MTDSEKLDLVIAEMQGMKSEMQGMKSEMQGMKSEMQSMKSDMQDMKSDIQGVKSGLERVENRVVSLELTIENSIIPDIQLVAEGHGILNRKLHEALKVEAEKEVFLVRSSIIEHDIRVLKERLERAAI